MPDWEPVLPKRKDNEASCDGPSQKFVLGPLEGRVLAIVCRAGEVSVRQVQSQLEPRYAYTTVMTTLARMHRKRVLERRTAGAAYVYSSVVLQSEADGRILSDLVSAFVDCRQSSHPQALLALASVLADYDSHLREELITELQRRSGRLGGSPAETA